MAEAPALLLGFVLTLMLHASVLLGAAWLLERIGALRRAHWAELAWRGALFGSLLAATAATLLAARTAGESSARDTQVVVSAGAHANAMHGVGAMSAASRGTASDPRAVPVATRDGAPRDVRSARAQDWTAGVSPALRAGASGTYIDPIPADGIHAPLATRTRGFTLPLPTSVIAVLAQAWLALTLSLLLLTAWRVHGLLRLQRCSRMLPGVDAGVRDEADALARRLGLARPRLHLQPALSSPVALPFATVLIPGWVRELAAPQRRALLAHELAHLQRRDPLWRMAMHMVLAPLWMHPLAWLARRRLDALAERQADAVAARLLGDGRPLAECLAQCLARQRATEPPATPALALAMAERPGAVVDRVQRLLQEDPMSNPEPSVRRTRLAIALGLCAALTLPTIAVTAFADTLMRGESVMVTGEPGRESVRLRVSEDDLQLKIDRVGAIVFADRESDVSAMEKGARLEISEERGGVTRSIRIEPSAGGVQRAYRVDGKPRAFDADGRQWLARVLPELFRRVGVDAEARAQRILARDGTDGLLDEIALLRGDHVRRLYLDQLHANATLDGVQFERALQLAGAIESDHELRLALATALQSPALQDGHAARLLQMAATIGSDHELAELLILASQRFTLRPAELATWSKTLQQIGSDYETRRVLEALLARDSDNAGAVKLALEAAGPIGSDYETRQLLEASLSRLGGDRELQLQYLRVAADIGSDHQSAQAVTALLRRVPPDARVAREALATVARIGSSHEASGVMQLLAQAMPLEAELLEAFRARADALSRHERAAVLQVLEARQAAVRAAP